MNQLSEQEMGLHVTIIGWLNIVLNGMLLGVSLFGCLFFVGLGTIAAVDSGNPAALGILGTIGAVALLFFGVLAMLGLLAGFGLLRRRKWGQILGIVDGTLNLLSFPIGTAIGAYTLFVLLQESATSYFSGSEAV
jgi:hypothetical protein